LAHRGVLFLDELTEFKRPTLEVLRQPLEERTVHVTRAQYSAEFPASFVLVTALNPCPCGYFGDENKECICSPNQRAAYMAKLSGPLLDRIDMHVHVSSITYDDLTVQTHKPEPSSVIRERVQAAVARQMQRQNKLNAFLSAPEVEQWCLLSPEAEQLMRKLFNSAHFSVRSYHRVLKVARTLADLVGLEVIGTKQLQEAALLRALDKFVS
jgi:magnesium chelatase family protein